MRKRGEYGVLILAIGFFLAFFVTSMNFLRLSQGGEYVETADERSFTVIHAGDSQGTIYDRNFLPLTNAETEIHAVAVPSAVTLDELTAIAADPVKVTADYGQGKPFVFICRRKTEESDGLTFFELPVRYSPDMTAVHTIGYISENSGVSGIEYAYDSLLRTGDLENSVTYSTDGFGHIMIGEGKSVVRSEKAKTGVVLTIDSRIQRICEKAGRDIDRGAIVVTDVKTGDILALASFPSYDVSDLSAALTDPRCPMINRALYSYSVGSIFKLVTACEGINEGFSGYLCDCTGSCDVSGQTFHCHKFDGHGSQDMTAAMTNSCNTYFIGLSRCIDIPAFRQLAFSMGLGREIHLCAGMISSGGVLPSVDELLVPAELANFSFGQGRLTATPLQISQMTCAIANGGEVPMLRIIRGITGDGKELANEKSPQRWRVMSEENSAELRKMMIAAIYQNENSNAAPDKVRAAAKTSTAQTGRFNSEDEELCHGWITGFYPASSPRCAITVLVEDGGYGNDSAAPVFKEIIDQLMK